MGYGFKSYLDCDGQCRRCLHLLFIWGWFSTVLLWEVIDPVGQHTRDKQSSPAFPTILFSDFRLVPFSSLWLFLSVYSWLYNKYAVKGFPVSTQILVDIVMFEDTFFIPYWKIQKCFLPAKDSWCTAVEILRKIQAFPCEILTAHGPANMTYPVSLLLDSVVNLRSWPLSSKEFQRFCAANKSIRNFSELREIPDDQKDIELYLYSLKTHLQWDFPHNLQPYSESGACFGVHLATWLVLNSSNPQRYVGVLLYGIASRLNVASQKTNKQTKNTCCSD